MQAHLAVSDELVVLGPTDLDPPELLRTALLDGDGDDVQAARSVRSEEVGDVRDPDGSLPRVLDPRVCAGRRERLDRRGAQAPVHDAPRLMVTFVGGYGARDLGWTDLIELDPEQGHQVARYREVGHRGSQSGNRCDDAVYRRPDRFPSLAHGAIELSRPKMEVDAQRLDKGEVLERPPDRVPAWTLNAPFSHEA